MRMRPHPAAPLLAIALAALACSGVPMRPALPEAGAARRTAQALPPAAEAIPAALEGMETPALVVEAVTSLATAPLYGPELPPHPIVPELSPAQEWSRVLHERLETIDTGLTREQEAELALVIAEECHARELDPELVAAMIVVESRFDATAVSPRGAVGLMQVLPSTGRAVAGRHGVEWKGRQTLLDPIANVRLGIAYLGELRERFTDLATTLAAYHRGPSAIRRRLRGGHPIPDAYAERVRAAWHAETRPASF